MSIKRIGVIHIKNLAHRLAVEMMAFDEPIPPFHTRFPKVLEGSLAAPFQTFAKQDLYPEIADKAAIIFYFLIKNHPFQNGNKRIAVTTLLTFLYLNKKWIETTPEQLYKLAVWVAESKPSDREYVTEGLTGFINKNLIPSTE